MAGEKKRNLNLTWYTLALVSLLEAKGTRQEQQFRRHRPRRNAASMLRRSLLRPLSRGLGTAAAPTPSELAGLSYTQRVKALSPLPSKKLKAPDSGIAHLPPADFEGRVTVACGAEEIEAAVRELLAPSPSVLGFDAEWKPSWEPRAAQNPTALVQLATVEHAVLLRLNTLRERGVPPLVRSLLEDGAIRKAGVGASEDLKRLSGDFGLKCRGAVDVEHAARAAGAVRPPPMSRQGFGLQALVAIVLSERMEKPRNVQLSNWERRTLTDRQVRYAATDAVVGLRLYNALEALGPSPGVHAADERGAAAAPAPSRKQPGRETAGKQPRQLMHEMLQRLPEEARPALVWAREKVGRKWRATLSVDGQEFEGELSNALNASRHSAAERYLLRTEQH